ncbi:MAG: inositol monophosphatase [Clostridia bacterium]|nr:inositol monophosphatase [Clostridia bacterium]
MDYNKIVSLVYQARKIVFSKSKLSQIENKNPYDFVTAVDTGISDFLKEELNKLYPDVAFMTEEESQHTFSDKIFILDPIDGTTNLIYDYKMSSISLAYAENGKVVFGVVFNPFTKEMFFAIKGNGSYRVSTSKGINKLLEIGIENYKTNPLKCSERGLKSSIIEFGASSSRKEMADETFGRASRIFKNCLDLRRICSSAIAVCYIAAARLDGYFEKIIKPWDYAAATLILAEAGGKSSDWNGNQLPLDKEGTIVCSNGIIYEDLLKLL